MEVTIERKMLWLFVFLCGLTYAFALDNGLALTPPMGFMSWERYRCITDCEKRPEECIRYEFKVIVSQCLIRSFF